MELAIYQVLEQIINVTEMTNKWMRWCEQSLPNQSVFVPSVFQMRDAYSHIIAMFAYGIEEQEQLVQTTENFIFDEVKLFKSSIAVAQFSEACEHTLRAYFDTADYIVERLSEICKNIDLNSKKDSYPSLRSVLNKYDAEISSLRAKKSLPPNTAYLIVERWDSLLQVITSAFSFADYEYSIQNLIKSSAFWLISTLISIFATTWVGQEFFLANSVEVAQLNYIFLIEICLLFIIIEFLFFVIWHIIRKIGFSIAKKKI